MLIFCTMISGWSSEKGSSLSLSQVENFDSYLFFFFKCRPFYVFMLLSSVSSARARDLRSDRVERCFWFQWTCRFNVDSKTVLNIPEAINNEENRRTEKGIINTESHWS